MINISAVHLFRILKAFPATKTNHKNCVVIRDHNLPANSPIQRCKLISFFFVIIMCPSTSNNNNLPIYQSELYITVGYSNEPDTSIHISGGLTIIGSRTKHNKEKKNSTTEEDKKTNYSKDSAFISFCFGFRCGLSDRIKND